MIRNKTDVCEYVGGRISHKGSWQITRLTSASVVFMIFRITLKFKVRANRKCVCLHWWNTTAGGGDPLFSALTSVNVDTQHPQVHRKHIRVTTRTSSHADFQLTHNLLPARRSFLVWLLSYVWWICLLSPLHHLSHAQCEWKWNPITLLRHAHHSLWGL